MTTLKSIARELKHGLTTLSEAVHRSAIIELAEEKRDADGEKYYDGDTDNTIQAVLAVLDQPLANDFLKGRAELRNKLEL